MFFEKNQTSEIKSFFNENGFAVIKNVFPKVKINDIRKIVLKNLNKNSKDFFYEFNDDKKILRRIEKITDHYHSIKDLIHSPNIYLPIIGFLILIILGFLIKNFDITTTT